MRVLVVSGIWPPDVGGPATHAPDVAAYLRERGHAVEAVTTASATPAAMPYPVRWVSRALPKGIRHVSAAALIRAGAARADVVYTTGMFARSAAAAVAAGRPYVVKLTGDPAFERARWRGLVAGDVDAFQQDARGLQVVALRGLRDAVLRRAAFVFCPSSYLRDLVVQWGVAPERVAVLPNPAPRPPRRLQQSVASAGARAELRSALGLEGATLAFAGRLTAQKSLSVALEALAATEGVSLVVVGEGPEREAAERTSRQLGLDGRVRFVGGQPRERVLELLAAADAMLLSSAWENFPHAVMESLAVGTPVLATSVGGVAEVVRDGENGLLVPPGDATALAASIRRYFGDSELRERLRAGAARSVADYSSERLFARLEETLAGAAASR